MATIECFWRRMPWLRDRNILIIWKERQHKKLRRWRTPHESNGFECSTKQGVADEASNLWRRFVAFREKQYTPLCNRVATTRIKAPVQVEYGSVGSYGLLDVRQVPHASLNSLDTPAKNKCFLEGSFASKTLMSRLD